MELVYKNETLFVSITETITLSFLEETERRIFRILDDYGIENIVISLKNPRDLYLLNIFKRNYFQKYSGFLQIQ